MFHRLVIIGEGSHYKIQKMESEALGEMGNMFFNESR